MKYIKRVTLENFQSHKFSVIDFNEQLNVIVGPSDSGKSAIIRGIKWVLYNEPTGDYFIKEGATECRVTLEFSDGVKLERFRSKYKNAYILINRDGEETKYEGFGSNIPEEIIQAIGIKKINLDSDESNSINIGEQLEGAFLLSEKGGTRASAIGRLVGVNIVDDALREALKDTRNLNIARKTLDDNIDKLSTEISEYEYLDDLKLRSININNIKNNIVRLNHRLEKLKSNFLKFNQIQLDKKHQTLIINKLTNLNGISLILTTIENRNLNYKELYKYNENLNSIKERIEEGNTILERLKHLNKINSIINNSNIMITRREKANKLLLNYTKVSKEIKDLNFISNKLVNIDKVDFNISTINNELGIFNKLIGIKSKIERTKSGIKIGNDYLQNMVGIDKSTEKAVIIHNKHQLLSKYKNVYNKVLTNREEFESVYKNIKEINKKIKDKLLLYEQLLKELEVCPFCLSSIDEGSIKHIIDHYVGGN